MGVYLVTLWMADSFSYLVKLTRNLQQVPRKTLMNMTQSSHYIGRDSTSCLSNKIFTHYLLRQIDYVCKRHTRYVYQHGPLYVNDPAVWLSGKLQILLRAFPFDLDQDIANPVWRFSWTSWNSGEWGTFLQSGNDRFLPKPIPFR